MEGLFERGRLKVGRTHHVVVQTKPIRGLLGLVWFGFPIWSPLTHEDSLSAYLIEGRVSGGKHVFAFSEKHAQLCEQEIFFV